MGASDGRRSEEILTVIVPCLNEAEVVTTTVEQIEDAIPSLPLRVELLLVDDGSIDATAQVLQRLCARFPNCRMRSNPSNVGLGRTVMASYESIPDGSWVTVLPGDNEIIFESIRNLLALRGEYDVILGYLGNPVIRTISRRAASALFTLTARMLYGFPYRYLNGLKLYRVETFRGIEVIAGGHGFNAELLAKAILRNPDLRVGEAPFRARGRSMGHSKAFRPLSVWRSMREALVGYRSVCAYRRKVIEGQS